MWSLHILLVQAMSCLQELWPLPTIQKHALRLIGDSKLTLILTVGVYDCLSLCWPCDGLATVQGVLCFLPNGSWDRLQSSQD